MKRVALIIAALAGLGAAGCVPTSPIPGVSPSANLEKAAKINVKLGVAYLKQGDLEQALKKLQRAVREDPTLASAHNVLARVKQRLGLPEEAEKHFRRALELKPDYAAAHNNYGVFLYSQGRYREAEAQFLKAIANPLYDTPALAYENAALAAQQQSDLKRAKKYYHKALQIRPKLPNSLFQLAKINFEQGHYLRAEEYLQRYRDAVPQHTPQSLWLSIRLARQLGDKKAASHYVLLLKQNFPESERAQLLRDNLPAASASRPE